MILFEISIRVLTPYEASSLVALLHTKDCEILERALVTVSNSAAFSTNQVKLNKIRDAGYLSLKTIFLSYN